MMASPSIVQVILLALGLQIAQADGDPSKQSGVATRPASATAKGEIALFSKQVKELSQETFVSSLYGGRLKGVVVESEKEEILLSALDSRDLESRLVLRISIVDGLARGMVSLATSTGNVAALKDPAGVAVLLTNGSKAALEFEISCLQGIDNHIFYAGRFVIADSSLERIKSSLRSHHEASFDRYARLVEEDRIFGGSQFMCRGYQDSLGRRQGLWTLLAMADGRKLAESNWLDGRLNGSILTWHNEELYSIRRLRENVPDGTYYAWYPGGRLRQADDFAVGKRHGTLRLFHPNGQKSAEIQFEHGIEVGERKRWSDTGVFLEPTPASKEWPMGNPVSIEMREFLSELEGLHTRM